MAFSNAFTRVYFHGLRIRFSSNYLIGSQAVLITRVYYFFNIKYVTAKHNFPPSTSDTHAVTSGENYIKLLLNFQEHYYVYQ